MIGADREMRHKEPVSLRVIATHRALRQLFARTALSLRKESQHERKLTQRALAARMGTSRELVVAIESGRCALTDESLAKLLVALDLTLIDFLATAAWHAFGSSEERIVTLLRSTTLARQRPAATPPVQPGRLATRLERKYRDNPLPNERPSGPTPRPGAGDGG